MQTQHSAAAQARTPPGPRQKCGDLNSLFFFFKLRDFSIYSTYQTQIPLSSLLPHPSPPPNIPPPPTSANSLFLSAVESLVELSPQHMNHSISLSLPHTYSSQCCLSIWGCLASHLLGFLLITVEHFHAFHFHVGEYLIYCQFQNINVFTFCYFFMKEYFVKYFQHLLRYSCSSIFLTNAI